MGSEGVSGQILGPLPRVPPAAMAVAKAFEGVLLLRFLFRAKHSVLRPFVKPELVDHRKFLRLKRLLGEPTPHVVGYLMMMWRRGYQTGNPLLGDALDVEAAAEYQGEPRKFATAANESGFTDRTGDDQYAIHDLWAHAPEWARKRMARTGHLPEGMSDYHGIKPGSCRTARKARDELPNGRETPRQSAERHTEDRRQKTKRRSKSSAESPPAPADAQPTPSAAFAASSPEPATEAPKPTPAKAPAARPRDELFDAIVTVTGADPKVNGGFLGRVRKMLAGAEPPYTPAEVLRLADRDFQSRELPWKRGEKLTIGELEKYIGRVRNPSVAGGPVHRPKDRVEAEAQQFADYAQDAFGGPN